MSERGEQAPQHVALVGHAQGCGCYSNCNRKLLEGSEQRGDDRFMF